MSEIDWDGTGLPPVGTVCEIAASTKYLVIRDYPEGTVVKIYANFTDDRGVRLSAFVDDLGKVAGVATEKCFRPIRTPEQTAAEEREKAIEEMTAGYYGKYGLLADWAAYVYDILGYRKQGDQP